VNRWYKGRITHRKQQKVEIKKVKNKKKPLFRENEAGTMSPSWKLRKKKISKKKIIFWKIPFDILRSRQSLDI